MPTYLEIQAQIDTLQKQAEEARQKEVSGVIADIKAKMASYGITCTDLGCSVRPSGKREKKVVTFRNPETGDTWDGDLDQKGRKPDWIKAKIKDGTIDRYRVKS